MRSARGYGLTLLLLAVAGGAAWVAYGRVWVTVAATRGGVPVPPVEVTGRDLHPLAGTLGLVLLAGVVAVLATRGRVRQGVGVLAALAGAAIAVPALVEPTRTDAVRVAQLADLLGGDTPTSVAVTAWWLPAGAAGLLGLAAGVVVVVAGRGWPAMSARYERAGAARTGPVSAWDALDRGEDPTL